MQFVFVYGTLMRGGCRSAALAAEQFIGTAKTDPRYRLVNCGEYPGLVDAAAGRAVEGEIWQVTAACLEQLDEIEDVANRLYARRPVVLQAPYDLQHIEAYFYLPDPSQLPDLGHRWVNP